MSATLAALRIAMAEAERLKLDSETLMRRQQRGAPWVTVRLARLRGLRDAALQAIDVVIEEVEG